MLQGLLAKQFIVDGELIVEIEGRLSFEALQMRLHPAESRVRKLAGETPARLVLFDVLALDGRSLLDKPLRERRAKLEAFGKTNEIPNRLVISTYTRERKKAASWLKDFGEGATDGVVCKFLQDVYHPGERAMVKVKRLRTADCVVGGFRYENNSRQVGSLLLGLYDIEGKLNHVGYTSTLSDKERAALTHHLESLRMPPGFTGKAPGGPSRWSTERSGEWTPLRPKLVAEVRFDHVSADRFRHGTKFLRWRPDKDPRQCTFDQIESPIAKVN